MATPVIPAPPPNIPAPTNPTMTSALLPAPNLSDGRNYRDDEFDINWGLGTINADAAYQRGYWGQGATVAVVDTGVRASHFNLRGNVLTEDARRFPRLIVPTTNGALDDPFTIIVTNGTSIFVGSHGTEAAGVIAGVRNMITFYGHGVAPSAKILPLRFSDTEITRGNRLEGPYTVFSLNGNPAAAFQYAANQNVHIINNSWGSGHTYFGHYNGEQDATIAFSGPVLRQLLQVPGVRNLTRGQIDNYANIFRNEDIAVVWAAGNSDWNSINGRVQTYEVQDYERFYPIPRPGDTYLPQQLVNNFVAVEVINDATVSISFRGATLTMGGNAVTVDAFEPDGFGDYALAPLYHPELLGRWLAVVATDQNNTIASFSNGCGSRSKHWCLAAPGVNITSAYARDINFRRRVNGTSFSAPHISGALALLKSRLPNMPMSVLVHLLLTTAVDLGEPGVDDVYGHGLVNISAAITMQGNIRLQSASSQGLLLQNANTELPSSFAGFAKRLNGVGVAAEYLDGFYYDAPLGGMIRTQSKKQKPLNFAAEMFDDDTTINEDGVFAFSRNGALRSAGWKKGAFQVRHYFHNKPSLWQSEGGDIVRRPFFADDGGYSDEIQMAVGDNWQIFAARGEEQKAEYSQMGISWRRSLSSIPKLRFMAAHSHISESDTLLGGKFGGLMPLKDGGIIRQTDIGASYALDSRWRLYGGYQHADINAKFGGIVGEMSGVMAEGWNSGFAARDWIREGDTFRIGIGKQTSISRGDMVLRINQSSNPQKDESTQAMHNRGYETTEQRISLAEEAPHFFAIGYAFTPGDNSQLAIALTHRRESPSALSINWRWDF